jgi:threonine/homoserine/homoserine lactone efflux protein
VNPEAWIALASVFIVGAMSPGPSLAVVLRNTAAGGRASGVATGIGHGIGFGIYAFSAAFAIATILAFDETIASILRYAGIVLLLYLGFTFLKHAMTPNEEDSQNEGGIHSLSERAGFVQGFLIAILNPKILAWFLALYAPFIEAGISLQTLLGMGAMGMMIDGTWYVTVATVLTRGNGVDRLRANARKIDGVMGILMFIFAGLLVSGAF